MDDRAELAHYGVLGMKWGVRRYQNADGSLTSAGKIRYNTGKPAGEKQTRQAAHNDHVRVHDGKKASELSDAELRERLNRLNMEQQYDRLTKGKSSVRKVLDAAATTATVTTTVINLYNNSDKLIKIGKKTFDAMTKLMGDD